MHFSGCLYSDFLKDKIIIAPVFPLELLWLNLSHSKLSPIKPTHWNFQTVVNKTSSPNFKADFLSQCPAGISLQL